MKKLLLAAAVLMAGGSVRAATEGGPSPKVVSSAGADAVRPGVVEDLTATLVRIMGAKKYRRCGDRLQIDEVTGAPQGVLCQSDAGFGAFENFDVDGSLFQLRKVARCSSSSPQTQNCASQAVLIYLPRLSEDGKQALRNGSIKDNKARDAIGRAAFVTEDELQIAAARANATMHLSEKSQIIDHLKSARPRF